MVVNMAEEEGAASGMHSSQWIDTCILKYQSLSHWIKSHVLQCIWFPKCREQRLCLNCTKMVTLADGQSQTGIILVSVLYVYIHFMIYCEGSI